MLGGRRENMNFETKYLIRWGIPGWLLLFSCFICIVIIKDYSIIEIFKQAGTKNSIGLMITLAGLGVPIGYMLHHVNFDLAWITKSRLTNNLNYINNHLGEIEKPKDWAGNKPEDYYYLEYLMHREISKLDEPKMNYLSERYRHLLSTTHSLGALKHSIFASSVLSLVLFLFTIKWILLLITLLCFLTYLGISRNYNYYSKNTLYFQGKMLNDFLKKKEYEN